MGDSLDAARAFIDEGQDQMETLHWTDAAPTEQSIHARRQASDPHRLNLCATLTKIQRGAKQIRARAIYLGAQDVLTAVESGQRTALIQDRLHTLKQLLAQYEAGLADIDQQMLAHVDVKEMVDVEETVDVASTETSDIDLVSEHETARETLASVIPFADPKDKSSLARLAAIHDPAPMQDAPPPAITEPSNARRPLEALMRPLIDEALGEARRLEKTISVSYDMGLIDVSIPQYDALAERLPQVIFALIQRSLPSGQVGHIDLTAIGKDIVLTARGPAPGGLGEDLTVDSDGIETRVIVPLNASAAGLVSAAPVSAAPMSGAPMTLEAEPSDDQELTPKPLITPETEAELRAQLSRLLDLQAAS